METKRFQELYVQLEKGGKFTPCYFRLDPDAKSLSCYSRATGLYETNGEMLISFNTSCISLVKYSSDAPRDCQGHLLYCFEIVYYQKTTKFAATAWSIMEEWMAAIKCQSVRQVDNLSHSDRMSMIGGYKAEIIGGKLIKTPLQSHPKPHRPKNKLVINPKPHPRPKHTSAYHTSDPDLFAAHNTSQSVRMNSSTNSLNCGNYSNSNGQNRLTRFASDAGPQNRPVYTSSSQINTDQITETPRLQVDFRKSNGHSEIRPPSRRFVTRFPGSSNSSRDSDTDLSSLTSPIASFQSEISPSLKALSGYQAQVVKTGFCVKQSSITKQWKRLYMVLGDQGLCYYKNDTMKKLIKRIWPKEVEEVRKSDSKLTIDRDNLMELHTSNKKYFIQFDTPEELNDWILEIRSHVGLSLVTYI